MSDDFRHYDDLAFETLSEDDVKQLFPEREEFTVRDRFASIALAHWCGRNYDSVAADCYKMADAMMKARGVNN